MDADDDKTLQIVGDSEATSGSNGGRMSITEEEANEASDGLETEDDDSNEDEDLSQDSSGEEVNTKEFNLPEEVWVHVWSFLNFKNCQQICTLVCKTWFDQIRNSSALSGELRIFRSQDLRFQEYVKFMSSGKIEKNLIFETKKFELEDNAEAVLSRWPSLKVLYVSNEKEIEKFGTFPKHQILEKIVISGQESPQNKLLSKKLRSWGTVTQSWFNPKPPLNSAPGYSLRSNKQTHRTTTFENVLSLSISPSSIPENFEEIAQKMINVESLSFYGGSDENVDESRIRFEHEAKIKLIAYFQNLKMLFVESGTDIQRFGNFRQHKNLTKIYIWGRHRHEYQELGVWGQVTSSWFNPKLTSNPPAIENVLELRIFPSEIPQNFEMTQISEKMKNLEKLKIFGQILDLPKIGQFISSFTNLKTVQFGNSVPLQGLIETLNSLATKSLWISGSIDVHELSGQEEIIFQEAVQILNEKFPGKHRMKILENPGSKMFGFGFYF